MIFDTQSLFSDAQAITADAVSTNIIDLGVPGTVVNGNQLKRDLGAGCTVPVQIQVVEDFNNLTSMIVTLQKSVDEAFTAPIDIVSSGPVLLADLKEGKAIPPMSIPQGTDLQFIRLDYDITGTAPSTGKITAGIVCGRQTN